jgi:hypothetical protein
MFERPKIHGVRRVSKKELRELSKLSLVVDEALSSSMAEARVLPDGRVLLVSRNLVVPSAHLFPSRREVEQWNQYVKEHDAEWAKMGGVFDPAKELLPPLDDFLRDVDAHAKSLGKVLRLSDDVLDRSLESLDVVHKAVVRIKREKRFTPEIFTPLTAYTGEAMRLVCDGRWGKLPATKRKTWPIYDPAEWQAFQLAQRGWVETRKAAGEKAAKEAKARGANKDAVTIARAAAENAVIEEMSKTWPKPIGQQEYDEPVRGHDREPVVWERGDGRFFQPLAAVVHAFMGERSDASLRGQASAGLWGWINAKRKAASSG